jgi:integrase/recombinase XerD
MAGMGPLLEYLRGVGVAPGVDAPRAVTPVDELLGNYRRYLLEERGLALRTTVPTT